MNRARNPNLQILELAVQRLGLLADDMVFLGGCATGLLINDMAAPPIRITRDVDVITELASLADYYRLSTQLRDHGFKEDQSDGAPICRWVADGVILDVMPTKPEILGFANEWYQQALAAAQVLELPSSRPIRMVTGPYFLATKLTAFADRGRGDHVTSHDMEDIVAVLDGRLEIVDEVRNCQPALRNFLSDRFTGLIEDRGFRDALPGHLPGDQANQQRLPIVVERIKAIAGAA